MNPEIVNNFVSNQIIKQGTELQIEYVSNSSFGLPSSMKGTFKVVRMIEEKGKFFFTLSSTIDLEKAVIATAEQINEIDGMSCDRIIKAFNLMDDGSKKPRKPRKKKIQPVIQI